MELCYVQHIIQTLQQFSLLEGCVGGPPGSFLTVAADSFVNVGLNLQGWRRKMLYVLSGGLVGILINYNGSKDIL